MNPRRGKKRKRKEILIQEGGAFLAPLLAPVLLTFVSPLLKSIARVQMAEGKKYIEVTTEVYEMLIIKAETPVNPIASTINKLKKITTTSEIVLEFLKKEKVRNKLRRANDQRNGTAYPLQKVSIDKMKEEKMNFETTFTQSSSMTLRSRGQLVLNYLKHSNGISWKDK